MTNDLVRGDVNWFDGRRSQRRSAKVSSRRKTVATAQHERRRLITLGLTMTFASLTTQPNPRCSCRLKTEDFGSAPRAASLDRCRSRIHLGLAVYFRMPYLKREVSGLRCGAGNVGIVDYFAVRACSGVLQPRDWPPRSIFASSIPPLAERSVSNSTSDVLEDCSMFKRSAVHYGRTPEPVTPYQGRLRSGTNTSALRECRRRTGA